MPVTSSSSACNVCTHPAVLSFAELPEIQLCNHRKLSTKKLTENRLVIILLLLTLGIEPRLYFLNAHRHPIQGPGFHHFQRNQSGLPNRWNIHKRPSHCLKSAQWVDLEYRSHALGYNLIWAPRFFKRITRTFVSIFSDLVVVQNFRIPVSFARKGFRNVFQPI